MQRTLALASGFALVTGILSAAVLVCAAPTLAADNLKNPGLAGALRIAALLVLFGSVSGAQAGVMVGFEAFSGLALTHFATFLLSVGAQAVGAWKFGLHGVLWGQLVGVTVTTVTFRVLIVRRLAALGLSYDWRGAMSEWRVLVHFSLPAVLSSALVIPVTWWCSTLLIRQTDGYVEMAGYAAANQWRSAVTFLPSLLAFVFFPVLSSLPKGAQFRRAAFKGLFLSLGAGAVVCLALAPFGKFLMAMYGPAFVHSKGILLILLLAGVLEAGNEILLRTLLALDRGWLRLISNGVWAGVMIFMSAIWIPKAGGLGLAWATLAALCAHFAMQLFLFIYSLPRSQTGKAVTKP